jgi:hypothetical protein
MSCALEFVDLSTVEPRLDAAMTEEQSVGEASAQRAEDE